MCLFIFISVFCVEYSFAHLKVCKAALEEDTYPVLPWIINPFRKGVGREAHESEMAGELYGPNVKIDPKVDRNGKKREDGIYLFAITKDADGQKRVLITKRFDMERPDKKYLNTHRSMFRKFRRELGDSKTKPLVMGEIDIVAGQILGYRSKAGSAYDKHEAVKTNRFDERRAIAEAMGFDLKAVDPTRLVNVARKLAEEKGLIKVETPEGEAEIVLGVPDGRHLKEEEFVKRLEIVYNNPLLKEYVQKIKKLMARVYELFPDHVDKNPINPLDFDSPLMKEIKVTPEDFQAIKQLILIIQDYGVESYVAYNVVFDLMPQLDTNLNKLQHITSYIEGRKKGSPAQTFALDQVAHEQYVSSPNPKDIEKTRNDLIEASGRPDPKALVVNAKVIEDAWKVKKDSNEASYFSHPDERLKLLKAQKLINHLKVTYKKEFEGVSLFDFQKFKESLKVSQDEDYAHLDDDHAASFLYELLKESEKDNGNPAGYYYQKHLESLKNQDDDPLSYPHPDTVVDAYEKLLGLHN